MLENEDDDERQHEGDEEVEQPKNGKRSQNVGRVHFRKRRDEDEFKHTDTARRMGEQRGGEGREEDARMTR